MKPKKYKKIKLAFGGKAMNIDTPQEILQKMQLDTQQAKAEAMQNSQGLRMAASVLGSMGSSMMQKGYAGMGKQEGMTGFMQRNVGDITSALNMMQGLNFAFGGDVPNVPVEIEGEEVGEMPDGSVFEAKGPSHEQGGIDITLPAGTEMFSKRIKIDGVSMADRKKSRKKKEVSLEKMVEDNIYDLLTKNSLNRTKAVNKKEEEADKKIQDFVGGIMQSNPQEHKYGRTVLGPPYYSKGYKQKFQPLLDRFSKQYPGIDTDTHFGMTYIQDMINKSGKYKNKLKVDGVGGQNTFDGLESFLGKAPVQSANHVKFNDQLHPMAGDIPIEKLNLQSTEPPFDPSKYGIDITEENIKKFYESDDASLSGDAGIINDGRTVHGDIVTDSPGSIGKPNKAGSSFFDGLLGDIDLGEFSGVSIGDAIGLAGNLYSAFEPMNNTLRNRAGDTPNINAFEDYGKEGLETLNETKKYVDVQKNKALADLELSKASITKRNRNSARGINTLRALDMAANAQTNNAQEDIYNTFTQQMMNILGQEAGMENQIDQVVMRGEQARDLADRQDRDNFYSQMAQDIATKGTGIQALGKNINQLKSNKENLGIIENLKKLGFEDNQIKEYMEMIMKSRGIVSQRQSKPKKGKR